jgi:hypothetical protein
MLFSALHTRTSTTSHAGLLPAMPVRSFQVARSPSLQYNNHDLSFYNHDLATITWQPNTSALQLLGLRRLAYNNRPYCHLQIQSRLENQICIQLVDRSECVVVRAFQGLFSSMGFPFWGPYFWLGFIPFSFWAHGNLNGMLV